MSEACALWGRGKMDRETMNRGYARRKSGFFMMLLVAAICLGHSACGRQVHVHSPRLNLTGEASWYGEKFHKRQTASGERFDMNKLTAAHPSLPFNTIVLVENLNNGRKVRVRINDRGPFIEGRIIDLSRKAAEKLDMIRAGVVPVRLEIQK